MKRKVVELEACHSISWPSFGILRRERNFALNQVESKALGISCP